MSRKLSGRERIILFICILTGFIYIFFHGALKPLLDDISVIKSRIVSKERRIKKNKRVLRDADNVYAEYDKLKELYKQDGSNDQIMSNILSEIKEVAAEIELTIPDLKPKKVRRQDYFNHFSVSLTLNSDFNDVMKFLYVLQESPHLFSVDEIQFDSGSRRRKATMKTRLVLSKIFILDE